MADRENVTARVASAFADVGAADWDRLAGSADPFLLHDFLLALEESGSVGGRSGWKGRQDRRIASSRRSRDRLAPRRHGIER